MWFRNNQETERKKITLKEIGLPKLILIVAAGVLLLLLSLPTGEKETKPAEDAVEEAETDEDAAWVAVNRFAARQEKQLEAVLAKVDGVGEVTVMITLSSSEEKVTLNQESVSEDSTQETDSAGGSRNNSAYQRAQDPVLVEGEDGNQPYVIQLQAPVVEGVVVVAEGAGKGTIDTEIIQAVEALFQIESHKIKVMKMQTR